LALNYYLKLEKLASTPASLFDSRFGVMRSAFFTEDYSLSKDYAALVLESVALNENLKAEAHYAKGISCYKLTLLEEAIPSLEWLVKHTTTFMGSEAQFTLAQIHFVQEELEKSKAEIQELLKMKPSYDFWIAKGLILKSRILVKENDLFQAEQNLKAVMEHYPIQDDGIIEEASVLWEEIMILKNPPVEKSTEDTETKIEINEE